MTSGNTGAVVYGLTYIKKDLISRVPDIYELETEVTIPLALHRPKRGLLLPETSACRCLTENQGIPWKQSCPILKGNVLQYKFHIPAVSPCSALSHC